MDRAGPKPAPLCHLVGRPSSQVAVKTQGDTQSTLPPTQRSAVSVVIARGVPAEGEFLNTRWEIY